MEYPVAVPHEPLALLPAAATAGTILSIVRLGITAHLFLALLVVSICHSLRPLSQGFGLPYARCLSPHSCDCLPFSSPSRSCRSATSVLTTQARFLGQAANAGLGGEMAVDRTPPASGPP